MDVKGSYFHPRAFEACEPEPLDEGVPLTPPLLQKHSSYSDDSDSDESDAVTTPPDTKFAAVMPQTVTSLSQPPGRVASYPSYVAGLHYDAYPEDRHRPQLARVSKQPTITIIDEGCLGGF